MKQKIVHLALVCFSILLLIAAVFFMVHLHHNHVAMLKVETVPEDTVVKGNQFPKSAKYFEIAINGHVTKSKSTASFSKVQNQRIDVDIDDFDTVETDDGYELQLKLIRPLKLKNQYGKTVHDSNYRRLVKQIVKNGHYDLASLSLLKTHRFYYAYWMDNVGLSDSGSLMQYNPRTKQFKNICELDGVEVVKIQELR